MKTATKSISFLSIRVNVPNEMKQLIVRTMAMSSIKKLHHNLAEEFRNYIADAIIPAYRDKSLTKNEALELVARAIGLERADMEPTQIIKREPTKYDHPMTFQKEFEERMNQIFPTSKKKG
jgi:uncharacterized protein YktB (UPF0637 family)